MSENSHALNIILFEPEIPPNTGNLIRLCANTGIQLHLIEPLGFSMDTKALRRAGLDYHESASVIVHADLEACMTLLGISDGKCRVFAISTRGEAAYFTPDFQTGDTLLFGPETRGLPGDVLDDERLHATLRIPMKADSRSLNLSNAVAIVAFEALRQLGFPALG
ncbi:MAG: tRNA (cytidine(34)-2'-O)-methyltransferase [Granulosicoccus sp.]